MSAIKHIRDLINHDVYINEDKTDFIDKYFGQVNTREQCVDFIVEATKRGVLIPHSEIKRNVAKLIDDKFKLAKETVISEFDLEIIADFTKFATSAVQETKQKYKDFAGADAGIDAIIAMYVQRLFDIVNKNAYIE